MNEYTAALAAVLGIKLPKLTFTTPEYMSKTQLGALDVHTRTIWIRREAAAPDRLFSIAHEMRHLWQHECAPELFAKYAPTLVLSISAYNKQPAEIDANAFAYVIMCNWFRLDPLFTGVSEDIKALIRARAEVIAAEYGGKLSRQKIEL